MQLSVPIAAGAKEKSLETADFESMMREHQRRIYRFLFATLRDSDAASTLTQECFLRAFKNWNSFRGDSSPATWLTRIAINLARDHRRDRKLTFWRELFRPESEQDQATVADAAIEPRANPERAAIAKQDASLVWDVVQELPTQQREIFILRFAEEMSIAEIADAMSLQEGTVKTHLFRALATVRKSAALESKSR
jgi:RNA polymerase sigma-70 factor (ECF subfamily)